MCMCQRGILGVAWADTPSSLGGLGKEARRPGLVGFSSGLLGVLGFAFSTNPQSKQKMAHPRMDKFVLIVRLAATPQAVPKS